MKYIDFNNKAENKNYFHLLQTPESITEDIRVIKLRQDHMTDKESELYKSLDKQIEELEDRLSYLNDHSSQYRLTGHSKEIEMGDILAENNFPRHADAALRGGYLIVNAVSFRDHKGVFKYPDDAKESFFEAACNTYPITMDEYNKMQEEKV